MVVEFNSVSAVLHHVLLSVSGSVSSVVHDDVVLRVSVYSQTDGFVFVVVNLVQVTKHYVSDQEQLSTGSFQLVFVDSELAFVVFCLVNVLTWWQLEHGLTDLEGYWLQVLGDISTVLVDKAEVVIVDAVDVWDGLGPLRLQKFEHSVWNSDVHASSVNDGWHLLGFFVIFDSSVLTVVDVLSFESPLFD